MPRETASARKIADHLSHADPIMARIIHHTGLRKLPQTKASFASLARTIVNQQISARAGEAILGRLRNLYSGQGFPPASWFLQATPEAIRGAGVSPQKASYLRDLAEHVVTGRLDFRRLPHQTDDEVIRTLTAVKGIGLWSSQMCLMFSLNRPDVLPAGDLGIRKAVGLRWGYKVLPAESTVNRLGKRWAPYRSHASFYLWMSLNNPQRATKTTAMKA